MPVRPVVKIGLLASFEGLHRRSGYEVLHAMRGALEDVAALSDFPTQVVIIPLALDAELNPARAALKLLADPDVKAIIGPFDPALVEEVLPILTTATIPWFLPMAIDPALGMAPATGSPAWAFSLVRHVATVAKAQGQQRLVLVGDALGWPDPANLVTVASPIPIVDSTGWQGVAGQGITADDALFWLGRVESGASYVEALRQVYPDVPIWLGPQGGDVLFTELTSQRRQIYWVTWLDDGYQLWAEQIATTAHPSSLAAYLAYRATEVASALIINHQVPVESSWHPQVFMLQDDGSSRLLDPSLE
ncbi:MAG: hypothetical protein R2932_08595 [Caldilineaceae bacterium]